MKYLFIMPFRYFLKFSFEGSNFSGWQVQPNALTVQELLEEAIYRITGSKYGVSGCGRTDAGVHARVFYAHFDVDTPLKNPLQTCFKLNRFLPPSIAIENILPVKADAHARFSALWREYHYAIIRKKDPFLFPQAYLVPGDLDIALMNDAAKLLLQYPDFECFSKVKTDVSNFNCTIMEANWSQTGPELLFVIRADRFLRNMVRAIVGTLLDVGRKRITLDELKNILDSRDRRKAGQSVPAKGLTLWNVEYPADLFLTEPEWFSGERIINANLGNEIQATIE
jgi:tRNA pseudouridine38-40 synthase